MAPFCPYTSQVHFKEKKSSKCRVKRRLKTDYRKVLRKRNFFRSRKNSNQLEIEPVTSGFRANWLISFLWKSWFVKKTCPLLHSDSRKKLGWISRVFCQTSHCDSRAVYKTTGNTLYQSGQIQVAFTYLASIQVGGNSKLWYLYRDVKNISTKRLS